LLLLWCPGAHPPYTLSLHAALPIYEWTLFHEAGHAAHFAWATVRPAELRTMGYGAPVEAFGELFRAVFTDPLWLARYAQALAELDRKSTRLNFSHVANS